jgi:hypothetical protein
MAAALDTLNEQVSGRNPHPTRVWSAENRGVGMLTRVFTVTFRLLAVVLGLAAETPSDPVVTRIAYVDHFAFGGVGFAGVTSPGEKDYRLILARPSAFADFEKLFAVGNIQAKCYALVAIRDLDHRKFAVLASQLRNSKDQVRVMSGCIVSQQALSSVIARVESGVFSPRRS